MLKKSLSDEVIGRLFLKLRINYGASFDRQMTAPAGIGLTEAQYAELVRAQWADELGGFAGNLNAIAHALDHLPEFMPSLPEFKNLCRNAPGPTFKALPTPDGAKPSPEVVAALQQATERPRVNQKAWAFNLARKEQYQAEHRREVSGHECLTLAQRSMWREALGLDRNATPADAAALEAA
jgi:hypothetical protein